MAVLLDLSALFLFIRARVGRTMTDWITPSPLLWQPVDSSVMHARYSLTDARKPGFSFLSFLFLSSPVSLETLCMRMQRCVLLEVLFFGATAAAAAAVRGEFLNKKTATGSSRVFFRGFFLSASRGFSSGN